MANITAGANPDELDRLAGTFSNGAGSIAAIQRSLNPQINSSPWHGRNADRFRRQWSGEDQRAIREAIAFLNAGADALRRNAEEQRRVSAVRGGVSDRLRGMWKVISTGAKVAGFAKLAVSLPWWSRHPFKGSRIRSLRDLPAALGRFNKAQAKLVERLARKVTTRTRGLLAWVKGGSRTLKGIGAIGSIVGAGTALREAFRAGGRGDVGGVLKNSYLTAYEGAGLIPIVGKMQLAWDLGYMTGTTIDHVTGFSDVASDNFITSTMYRRYGSENLTSAQSHELATRYDGAKGVWNFGSDVFMNTFAGWGG